MHPFLSLLEPAVQEGKLLASSRQNLLSYLEKSTGEDWEIASLRELVEGGQWTELNDRFYQVLKFGTGGLRGRTMGRVVTTAERGSSTGGAPDHPAVGTNTMNGFSISRATQGMVRYLARQFPGECPKVVVSHDTRYFSRSFAEQVAGIVARMGGTAFLFEAERSTPELSFAVRHLGAHAGIMLTASHNPPHDNGFKAYYRDGGQLVEPQASAIIAEVLAVPSAKVEPAAVPGQVVSIGAEVDQAYLAALATLVLDPAVVRGQSGKLKIVFTPIHGTGIQSVPKILTAFSITHSVVAAQAAPDGGFPTVKSPNPENAEALALAIEQGRREQADFIAGTDPDADRMGVAVRDAAGEFQILTGNMIGSILAAYRIDRLFEQGVLTPANAARATLIKTFVTTDLQAAIARKHGLKCVDTLTGFKYIGEKLKDYEEQAGGRGPAGFEAWRQTLLEKSTFFVFGGEESYGYSGGDAVRDKDANAAVLMFAEAAAWAKSKGMTLIDYLDGLYLQYGLYLEKLGTLTFEGAEGAARIGKLLQGYREDAPRTWGGRAVEKVQNFSAEDIFDVDGKKIPKELMFMFHLAGGFRVAVRGSGTEPKIKYYFFGRSDVSDRGALPAARAALRQTLDDLWEETQRDVKVRVE
ncbi:MAG: phospho-sugar mutase [Candidatus Methylacidiphilales bacterium]|nr:phospho-sugar mutase [Candidatus Methylacidiphilales bacterium]